MDDDLDFEIPVITAIRHGKKIEAIKLLRESRNIGLKDAKELVDQYCAVNNINPPASTHISARGPIFIIVICVLGYFVYKTFA